MFFSMLCNLSICFAACITTKLLNPVTNPLPLWPRMDKASKMAVLGLTGWWELIHSEIALYFSCMTFLDCIAKTSEQYYLPSLSHGLSGAFPSSTPGDCMPPNSVDPSCHKPNTTDWSGQNKGAQWWWWWGFQQGCDLGLVTIPPNPATSAWSHTVLSSLSPPHRLPSPALVLMRPWSEGVGSLRDTDVKQGDSCGCQPSTLKTQKQGVSMRVSWAGTASSRWGRVLRFASSCIDIKHSNDLLLERA